MSDRLVEIHINMQGRVIVRYDGGKCVDVTDTRGTKLYTAPPAAKINRPPALILENIRDALSKYHSLCDDESTGVMYDAQLAENAMSDFWSFVDLGGAEIFENILGNSPPAAAVNQQLLELETYDAGYLNDFGGGNVSWWHDYIRSELGRAHDFYSSQIAAAQEQSK